MNINKLLIFFSVLIFVSCSKTKEEAIPLNSNESESQVLNKKSKKQPQELYGVLTYNYTTDFDLPCKTCDSGFFSSGNYYGEGV